MTSGCGRRSRPATSSRERWEEASDSGFRGRTRLCSVYGGVHKLLFVRVGTLDDPAALTPDVHIYVRSKLPWVALPRGTPSFDAYYDSRKLWPQASLERRRAIFG